MNQDTNAVANIFGTISFSISWNLKSFGVLIYIFFLSVPIGFYILMSSLVIFFLHTRLQKKEQERRKERDKESE